MKNKYAIALFGGFLVAIIPLALYFLRFNSELSSVHAIWGEFGALYGGVLGPAVAFLAFVGLLWNLDLTKSQFRAQGENNTFFKLIDLHNNKVRMIEFERSGKNIVAGFEAFKEYSEEFSRIYDEESIRVARLEFSRNVRSLTHNAGEFLWTKYAERFNGARNFWDGREANIDKLAAFFENYTDTWDVQKTLIGDDDSLSDKDRETLVSIGHVKLEDSSPRERVDVIKKVNEHFYHDYGHMLGHYFRNIHYILKFIEATEKPVEYSKLFRAQLSRYELAMIYYNAISEQSSEDLIRLVLKYDLLNGIYPLDICYVADAERRSVDLDCILQQKLKKP